MWWSVYPEHELAPRVDEDFAELLRLAGLEADADVYEFRSDAIREQLAAER